MSLFNTEMLGEVQMALSIDDLRTFLLVSSERSVSKAASRLGVTQQSVSERIRRLESRVGVELFLRLPHGMQPSNAGFRLLPYAHQAVGLIDEALTAIDTEDLVRVRVQRSVASVVLPLLENGDIKRDISLEDDASAVLTAVSNGTVDAGIGVFSDGDEAASSLVIGVLFDDPVVWVVPPEHPLARRQEAVSPSELNGLAVGVSLGETGSVANGNGHSGAGAGAEVEGPRIAPRSSVAEALAEGRLVEVSVELPGWVVPISIAYRSSDYDRPAITALRSQVASERHRVEATDQA